MREIVSANWLKENLNNPNLIILDASIEASADGVQATKSNFTIPFTRKFDLKKVFSNKSSPFPNTIPKIKDFEFECRKLGINENSNIVVFDNHGIYSSPRVWWLFNLMGHKKIAVLNGGLPNWIQNGFQTEEKHFKKFDLGNFRANYKTNFAITFEQVKRNINEKSFVIVDARSKGRFNGTKKEPRKHLQSGKIPNSINIPYQEVLANGKYKTKKELNDLFVEKCNQEEELVFSCGSGMTACIVMLACQIGYIHCKKVYDGSWTEWAELNNLKNVV